MRARRSLAGSAPRRRGRRGRGACPRGAEEIALHLAVAAHRAEGLVLDGAGASACSSSRGRRSRRGRRRPRRPGAAAPRSPTAPVNAPGVAEGVAMVASPQRRAVDLDKGARHLPPRAPELVDAPRRLRLASAPVGPVRRIGAVEAGATRSTRSMSVEAAALRVSMPALRSPVRSRASLGEAGGEAVVVGEVEGSMAPGAGDVGSPSRASREGGESGQPRGQVPRLGGEEADLRGRVPVVMPWTR